MVDCMMLLLQGNILGGITCTWTNVIGLWFYALMLASLEITIFIKYDNLLAPTIMGTFAGILMISFLPPVAWGIPITILIINVAAVIYSTFTRE